MSTPSKIPAPHRKGGKKHTPVNLAEAVAFITRFASAPTSVGAVFPSSRDLAEAMLHGITLEPGDVVVEYGPGTGAFTELIIERLPEGAEYLGIERDPHFHGHLQRRFPERHFHLGSAEEIQELLKGRGLKKPRLIISGLPFASMPHAVQEMILEATREALHEEGIFRTFTYPICWYMTGSQRFRKVALDHFDDHHKSRTVHRNIPPAKVLSYSKPSRKKSATQ
jgi:phosphatidylethanolamine/phosphatidyl-N-methylethanolamine N-methyltransferase